MIVFDKLLKSCAIGLNKRQFKFCDFKSIQLQRMQCVGIKGSATLLQKDRTRKMQKLTYFCSFAIVIALSSVAVTQEQAASPVAETVTNPRAGHLAIGFELTDFQTDFGLGINITSPYFAHQLMAVRVHSGISWLKGIPNNKSEYDWMLYIPIRLGFTLSVGMVGGHSRLYSEAGGILVVPNKDFSKDIAFGGYGLFGFEFFTTTKSPVTYFLQAGGVGSSGKANKLAGEPSYENGFITEVGIRWYPY